MKKYLLLILVCNFTIFLNAQSQLKNESESSTTIEPKKEEVKEEKKTEIPVSIKIGGFVMENLYYDTRKGIASTEDLLYMYPNPELLDSDGNDINRSNTMNFVGCFSRLSVTATGPTVFNAATKAYIEADYTGYNVSNDLRLRQAYINFEWKKSNLLIGQTWHVLSSSLMPNILSINTGIPYQSFNRNPQITYTFKPVPIINILGSVVYQAQYRSTGPNGASYEYQRNSTIPDLTARIEVGKKSSVYGGVAYNTKWIKPRQSVTATKPYFNSVDSLWVYETHVADELLQSSQLLVYISAKSDKFEISCRGTYSQNAYEYIMPTGYAVASYDSTSGKETYTNMNYISAWLFASYGKNFKVGIFGGIGKNLGASDDLSTAVTKGKDDKIGTADDVSDYVIYGRDSKLDYSFRISPFASYKTGPFQIGAEVEYTAAAWGTVDYLQKAKVEDSELVANFRYSLRLMYSF